MADAPLADKEYQAARAVNEKRFSDGHSEWLQQSATDAPAGVWRLAERCSEFLWDELKAYGASLQRRDIPPSERVSELERYSGDLVSQTRRRKWTPGLAELAECANIPPSADGDWDHIVQYLAYYFHQVVEPWLWGYGKEPFGTELRPRRGKRGPTPKTQEYMRVADVVQRVAPTGKWAQSLDEICKKLDESNVPVLDKWKDAYPTWSDRLRSDRHVVKEAIRYRLSAAKKADA